MKIYKTDLIERRDRNKKNTLWVSERLIAIVCDFTGPHSKTVRSRYKQSVSVNRRDQNIMPDTGKSWRYAWMNGMWYYDYERIPNIEPVRYQSKLGTREDLLAMRDNAEMQKTEPTPITRLIEAALDSEWRQYTDAYEGLKQQDNLAKGAAVVAALAAYIVSNDLDVKNLKFWHEAGRVISEKDVPYVPSWPRRVREKVKQVLGGHRADEVVVLPRAGNDYAQKVWDEQVVAWSIVLRASGANFTTVYISRKIREMCTIWEKKCPSQSWLEHLLAKEMPKNITDSYRYSGHRRVMNYEGYVPQEGAVFSGDCWMVDGTRVNMIEFTEGGNKWSHLTVVMVYDAHSGAVLARAYGLAENRWLYMRALRMAGQKAGYLPYELITDRFPGSDTDEWKDTLAKLQSDGVRVTTAFTMQGKARMERAISTVQMIGMQGSDKYYGEGVQSRNSYAHRSDEAFIAMRKRARAEGWNMQRAIEEAEKAFKLYNDTRLCDYSDRYKAVEKSPTQLHADSLKPHSKPMESWEMLRYFGHRKEIQVTHDGMIHTEIERVEYIYLIDVKYFEVMVHHKKVVMYYDLDDLSTVRLFEPHKEQRLEKYLCEAYHQPRINRFGPDADADAADKVQARNKAWKAAKNATLQHYLNVAGVAKSELPLYGTKSTKAEREAAETEVLLGRSNRVKPRKATPEVDEVDFTDVMVVEDDDMADYTRLQY
jgi:hypothetical protein